jgi:hypothetical protein
MDEKHGGQWDPELVEHFVEMITRMDTEGGREWSGLQ